MAESIGAMVARMRESHKLPARPRAALLAIRVGASQGLAQRVSAANRARLGARTLDGLADGLQSACAWPGGARRNLYVCGLAIIERLCYYGCGSERRYGPSVGAWPLCLLLFFVRSC